MTPAQRKQANSLIRRECCCYEDGNCMLLDDGDTHTCPQTNEQHYIRPYR
nr:cysteine-rich VLP protein [Faecalibacterium prausnitzii]